MTRIDGMNTDRNDNHLCRRTSSEIAIRSLVLQGTVAVASGCEAGPIVDWLVQQSIWTEATPIEREFLRFPESVDQRTVSRFQWHMEAEWTLLWCVGYVGELSWPILGCNSGALVDNILPQLGDDIAEFVSGASLRAPEQLLEEDVRSYNAWCDWNASRRKDISTGFSKEAMILYERRYAFEWLDGFQEWDDVTCDT